jgi:hypothetical protein
MADFTAWVEQNKALWSRVYDEVIQPSLEKEWTKSMYDCRTRQQNLMPPQEKRGIKTK